MDHWRTYYAMKSRLGGEKLTGLGKIRMQHYYPCPGCNLHNVSPRRRKILFERYVGKGSKAYAMYWRSHPIEHSELLASINKK